MPNLEQYRNRLVNDLVAPPDLALTDPQKERHHIFALLVMALAFHYWNGNKRGQSAVYPRNVSNTADTAENPFLRNDYRGHNIVAIAVDIDGRVIDFDFNHNELLHSSVEHAEARVVRRVYSLVDRDTQIGDYHINQTTAASVAVRSRLGNATIYTSLESCAQCAGIMTLASVENVVYLQDDPGQYAVGNILWRMTDGAGDTPNAPRPIAASCFAFPYYTQLNDAFLEFRRSLADASTPPFAVPANGAPDRIGSITSFLCTKAAWSIYQVAWMEFLQNLTLQYPSFQPTNNQGHLQQSALSNQECLVSARQFYHYATSRGFRGTPHL